MGLDILLIVWYDRARFEGGGTHQTADKEAEMNKQEAAEMRAKLEQNKCLAGRIIREVEISPGHYEVKEGRICRVCHKPYYTKAIGEGSRTDPCQECRKAESARTWKQVEAGIHESTQAVRAHEAFDQHEEPRY